MAVIDPNGVLNCAAVRPLLVTSVASRFVPKGNWDSAGGGFATLSVAGGRAEGATGVGGDEGGGCMVLIIYAPSS